MIGKIDEPEGPFVARRRLSFTVDEAIRGTAHGGKVDVRVLINEETCGSKGFSLLVNTIKAGSPSESAESLSHKHEIEHGVFGLAGHGKVVISGEEYDLQPWTAVFVPANEMHYVANLNPSEDLTYVIIYVPAGEERQLLAKG